MCPGNTSIFNRLTKAEEAEDERVGRRHGLGVKEATIRAGIRRLCGSLVLLGAHLFNNEEGRQILRLPDEDLYTLEEVEANSASEESGEEETEAAPESNHIQPNL